MRSSLLLVAAMPLALAGCPSQTTPADASDVADAHDAPPEASACVEATLVHSLYPSPLYVQAGMQATMALRLHRDRGLCGADYTLTSDNPAVLTAPASVHIDPASGYVEFTVTGVSAGHTQLHVVQSNPQPISASALMTTQATADVTVSAPSVPSCPTGTMATGHLAPGATVHGAAGSQLEPASITIPATATDAPVDVTISCAPDQLPAGYDAIGPAVTFAPGPQSFSREMVTTIPINPSLVPSMYELQTEIAYTGPTVHAPRVVAFANTRFTLDGKSLSFETPRLGTFQAVIRHGLGTHHVTRHFTWHSIMGVSMGALGSSMIGMRHADRFDSVISLGGPADWVWFGNYFRTEHMGGFCTAAQRAAGVMDCSMASNDRTPPPDDFWTNQQNFEYFYYPDGRMNQGGTYTRASYMQIFRDLAHMFGNPLMPADPANGILPLGVPAAQLTMSDMDRCAAANIVHLSHYCDDEFNPDGTLPVITFCDGNHVPMHSGEFTPGQGFYPFDIGLAVDLNSNGIRDPGEPVIRDLTEPWNDDGVDHTPDAMEAGYDPVNNPDPAGDDYDRQFNPAGTEGNHIYDMGEHFDDVGLDGVANSSSHGCMYDQGEGNGHWDMAPGIASFLSHNAAGLYAALPQSEAHRLAVYADGGTRDFFQLNESSFHYAGAVTAQNESLHIFNNFSSLVTGVPVDPNSDTPNPPMYPEYQFTDVDWFHLPRHSSLRYGFWDATANQIISGDGSHVGTVEQATNRFYTAFWFAQANWPQGDRHIVANSLITDNAGHCTAGNVCSFDFTSTHANRTGPISIFLPPGYFDPANASETYPVLFVLHGYGMQPQDLLATGILVANYGVSGNIANWQRPSKFIMVFPDGRCRPGDGCVNGTFYVDSPNPGNAQIETFFLDVVDYVDHNFRVRPASDVEVVE